jgi:hypothetical protein
LDESVGSGLLWRERGRRLLGISIETLRRWDKKGRILTEQDSRNQRRISAVEADRLSWSVQLGCRHTEPFSLHLQPMTDWGHRSSWVAISPSRGVALITRDSAEEFQIQSGDAATAIVKSTSMMIEL